MRRLLVGIATIAALLVCAVIVLRRRADPDDPVVPTPAPDLDSMTRDELYELAREHDIAGRSRMRKGELRAVLSRATRSG